MKTSSMQFEHCDQYVIDYHETNDKQTLYTRHTMIYYKRNIVLDFRGNSLLYCDNIVFFSLKTHSHRLIRQQHLPLMTNECNFSNSQDSNMVLHIFFFFSFVLFKKYWSGQWKKDNLRNFQIYFSSLWPVIHLSTTLTNDKIQWQSTSTALLLGELPIQDISYLNK